MNNANETLKRTKLKNLGGYLLDTVHPQENVPQDDSSAEDLLIRAQDELENVLGKTDPKQAEKIRAAVEALEEIHEKIGFFNGLKAGARLILTLTDNSDIVY